VSKRERWAFFLGGGDRVHLWCARCDTSLTILFGPYGIRVDEMARLARGYALCHRACRRQIWNERARLLRLLRRRPLPRRPAERQETDR
jgi:hypothetical protein